MTNSNNIRELRKKHGMSVDELADKMGVHTNTVYNWERGDTEPKSSQICVLSEIFECDAETILSLNA